MIKKILDNFVSIDKAAARFVMAKFDEWKQLGVTNPAEVFDQICEEGGHINFDVSVGCYLFGNMYNAQNGLAGELANTSRVIGLSKSEDGHYYLAQTTSGSSYLLLEPYTPSMDIYERLEKIIEVAPEPLVEYLRKSVPFWAPERLPENLTVAVNRLVTPSSDDPVSVKVYALLCDVTETEMLRMFKAKGL